MLSKAWDWAKKNKGKLIIGGIVLGGVIYVGRKLHRKANEINELLTTSISNNELLQQLSLGRSQEWKMTLHFQRNQKVSDLTVKKCLQRLRTNLYKLFYIDEITSQLRENALTLSPDQKATYFNQIKTECISRTISAIYAVHLLLLLHRIEINIIGRQMYGTPDEVDSKKHEENFTFLSSTRFLQDEGLPHLVNAISAAVNQATENIAPQALVTSDGLEEIFRLVCSQADKELLEDGQAVKTMLPEDYSLDYSSLVSGSKAKVTEYMHETRDMIECPQFLTTHKLAIAEAITRFFKLFNEKFPPGQQFPLARSFGRMCQLVESVLSYTFSNVFIEDFSGLPAVNNFCELIYFPPNFNHDRIPRTPSIVQLLDRLNFSV